jgi:gluconate 2-dehydrogenase subunit 3-like protein
MNAPGGSANSTRRGFLATVMLWREAIAAAQSHVHASAAKTGPYRLAFFTPHESRIVEMLAARIVPADERSGGAAAARVHEYIDFILIHAPAELQKLWRASIERIAPRVIGKSAEEIDALLSSVAANEFTPQTKDEVFFVALKEAVTDGFYTSEEGIRKELGYQGDGFLHEFPGCTHTTHETPAGYRPLLKERSGDA